MIAEVPGHARGVRARRRRRGRSTTRPTTSRPRPCASRRAARSSPTPRASRSRPYRLLGSDRSSRCSLRGGRRSSRPRIAMLVDAVERGMERLRASDIVAPPQPRPRKVRRRASARRAGHKSLADYTHLVGRPLVEEIRELAEPLQGKRVLHLTATAFGGGVSEILYTLIPLMRDVGLEVEWQVISGARSSSTSPSCMHNALQGNPHALTEEEWAIFDRYNEMNAARARRRLGRDHRPRPAAGRDARGTCRRRRRRWVWRCHIDLSTPNPDAIEQLVPLRRATTTQSVFHLRDYVPPGMDGERQHLPAGDRPALAQEHGALARGRGLRLRPVRHRRRPPADVPGLALRPLEGPARRDRRLPDGQGGDARRAARAGRLDGHRRPRGLGLLQLDASPTPTATRTSTSSTTSTTSARSRSTPSSRRPTCVIQKSTREGFGLTVSEALWKGRPVHRRRRRRHPAAGRGRRDRLPRLLPRGVRRALARDPARPGARQAARAGAARSTCASTSSRPRLLRDWLRIFQRLAVDDPRRDRRSSSSPNRGPATFERGRRARQARRRRPRDRADRAGSPPRRGLDRLGDDRRGRRGQPREHGGEPFEVELGRRQLPRPARRVRPGRLRPLLQRHREPDAVVHPALPLGPLERPGHPPRTRSRPTSTATTRSTRTSRAPCSRRSRTTTSPS